MISPFTHHDRCGWAGATGDAHTVTLHKQDADYFVKALGLGHVDPECILVILDEVGLTWNIWSPVNSFTWQIQVRLDVSIYDPPMVGGEYWESDKRYDHLDMTGLSTQIRETLMASPAEVRGLVLEGIRAAEARKAQPQNTEDPLEYRAKRIAAVRALAGLDMSNMPGLYDEIPWERLEGWAGVNDPGLLAALAKRIKKAVNDAPSELEHQWPNGQRPAGVSA